MNDTGRRPQVSCGRNRDEARGTDCGHSDECRSDRRANSFPKPDRRRALELLASYADGRTEAMLLARGFTGAT